MATPPPPGPDLDLSLWAAALTLAGFYWGPRAAQFISAYALILLGWFAGLLIGLYYGGTGWGILVSALSDGVADVRAGAAGSDPGAEPQTFV